MTPSEEYGAHLASLALPLTPAQVEAAARLFASLSTEQAAA